VPLRVLEAKLNPGSPFAGHAVEDVEAGTALRVLAIDGAWGPKPHATLTPESRLAIVGTREACDALLEARQSP
jgi:Trk K+ transport system NAD-binding subunit